MKQAIFQLLKDQGDLSWEQIVTRIAMTALLGVVIFVSYAISHRGTIYSRKFNVSLVILAVLTGTVMIVIGNNIALSLGMVGALSIVRFRTAIKDSRDTIYVFWTIIAGICCGVGDYFVAAVGSMAVFVVFLVFGSVRSDTRMLLIVRGERETDKKIEALVFQMFRRKAVLRVKNTTNNSVEYIFELSRKTLDRTRRERPDMTDDFYKLEGVESVNVVAQSDEIYN